MKKFLLFLAVFESLAFWACSNDKVAGISTVETENAYLIQLSAEIRCRQPMWWRACVLWNMSGA